MPEQWLMFVQEKWWALLLAGIALIVVVNVLKTILKWVLVAVIIGVVLIYGSNYKDEITAMGDQVIAEARDSAYQAFMEQAMNATYESREDGTYVVYTEMLRAEGHVNSDEVTVYWKDLKIGTFQIDETIRAFIEQAKASGA